MVEIFRYVNENDIDDGEDEHLVPASGEEYLRKVVRERKKYEIIETGMYILKSYLKKKNASTILKFEQVITIELRKSGLKFAAGPLVFGFSISTENTKIPKYIFLNNSSNIFFSVAANADELLALPTENSTHVNRCKADTSQQEVYLPTANWQNEQINQFTNVRLKISRHFALSKKEQHQVEENSKIKTPKVQ